LFKLVVQIVHSDLNNPEKNFEAVNHWVHGFFHAPNEQETALI